MNKNIRVSTIDGENIENVKSSLIWNKMAFQSFEFSNQIENSNNLSPILNENVFESSENSNLVEYVENSNTLNNLLVIPSSYFSSFDQFVEVFELPITENKSNSFDNMVSKRIIGDKNYSLQDYRCMEECMHYIDDFYNRIETGSSINDNSVFDESDILVFDDNTLISNNIHHNELTDVKYNIVRTIDKIVHIISYLSAPGENLSLISYQKYLFGVRLMISKLICIEGFDVDMKYDQVNMSYVKDEIVKNIEELINYFGNLILITAKFQKAELITFDEYNAHLKLLLNYQCAVKDIEFDIQLV
jgi:hypothetical protein